jgi:hypothetical protein
VTALSDPPAWVVEKNKKIDAARGPFDAVLPYATLDHGDVWGRRRPAEAFRRVVKAFSAVRNWRYANNQQLHTDELEALSVRVCADQFARDIEDAASGGPHDPATIAWVLAGLRCPRRPFCRGCRACFTITSPLRPTGDDE